MPTRRSELDLAGAAARIAERSFRPGVGDRVGIEVEAFPVDRNGRMAGHRLVAEAVEAMGPLASGTTVTFEPGGQLELSTPPGAGLDDACAVLASDMAAVDGVLARSDVGLVGLGLAPHRCPWPAK
jgi:glutamate--cysteine ligase